MDNEKQALPENEKKSSSKLFTGLMVSFTVIGIFVLLILGALQNFEIDSGSESYNQGDKFFYFIPVFILITVTTTILVNKKRK